MSSEILSRTAAILLDENEIVRVTIKQKVRQSLEDAKANIQSCKTVAGFLRRPIMLDIRKAEPLEPATRHYYRGRHLAESFSALALLVEQSPLGMMMGNVYLQVAKLGIPVRLFSDERKAVTWLKRFR